MIGRRKKGDKMDGRLHIEIALRGSLVAKAALEFVGDTRSALLDKLRYTDLVDKVNELRASIAQAAAEESGVVANSKQHVKG